MSPRVLIVDSDLADCELWASHLEAEGYEVDTVGSKREALERLQQVTYAAVVMNACLPDSRDLSLLQEIRETSPQTVCVATTVYTSTQTRKRVADLGAVDYLLKPIGPERVCDVLRKALGR
jgi:DNA-binding response OmpR family regulator